MSTVPGKDGDYEDKAGDGTPSSSANTSTAIAIARSLQAMEFIPEFKVMLIGDGGVGKTTFVKQLSTGKFEPKYVATLEVKVYPLLFHTTRGPIRYNVWDTVGQERPGDLRDNYYAGMNCAIIMCDLTDSQSQMHLSKWYSDLGRHLDRNSLPNIPIVLVGNKVDVVDRKWKKSTSELAFPKKQLKQGRPVQTYDISAKNFTNSTLPFVWLTRKLSGDNSVCFTDEVTN